MGNIIKINMYVKMKKRKDNKLRLKAIEEIILKYKSWLRKTNREDIIENYEEFLHVNKISGKDIDRSALKD